MSSRDPIRPLSDNVINQIAAGEVIERPASIVKELIENSLDAGATRITVDLAGGGIERIRIRDDGHGIVPDQLHLALSRHCTSKRADASELVSIASLGFRGEALASIAAVAEMSITSRAAEEAHGWRVEMRPGGEPAPPHPQAHASGTTIEVCNLFATTPVRRRFLKRPRTEFLHIQQFVRRAGFCYPEVAFELVHDGRQNLALPAPRQASAAERRWRTLFGSEFMGHARPLDVAADELAVRGWVGELGYSRQNSDLQYVAINRRIVRDRHISHAVRMAYDNEVEEGRHAAYALRLELPSAAVDVNVHPGKAEVRFLDPRNIHDLVYAAVIQTLGGTDQSMSTPAYGPTLTKPLGIAERDGSGRARQTSSAVVRSAVVDCASSADNLLAIVADRFALTENQGVLQVMDVRAAIRAVVCERLRRGECDPRPLIIPAVIDSTADDESLDGLRVFGVDIGRLGEASIALRAIPVVVNEVDPQAYVAALLAAVAEGDKEIDAIASAAAAAFRAPPGLAERRRWFASLEHRLLELGYVREDFSVILGPDELSRLFVSAHR